MTGAIIVPLKNVSETGTVRIVMVSVSSFESVLKLKFVMKMIQSFQQVVFYLFLTS